MPMIVIDLDGAKQSVLGHLSRRLLEIRPGTFVGALSARAVEQMWQYIQDSKPRAAMLVRASKNELGMDIVSIGQHRYQACDGYGIALVSFMKRQTTAKIST